jgi:hypothetical protein
LAHLLPLIQNKNMRCRLLPAEAARNLHAALLPLAREAVAGGERHLLEMTVAESTALVLGTDAREVQTIFLSPIFLKCFVCRLLLVLFQTVTTLLDAEELNSLPAPSQLHDEVDASNTQASKYAGLPSGWDVWRSWHTAFFHYKVVRAPDSKVQDAQEILPPRGVQFAAFPFQRLKEDPRRSQKGAGRRR